MKYHGTHTCGHEGTIELFGKTKDHEWKMEKYFSDPCPECLKIKREEENKKKNEENKEKSQKANLPELKGTDKQVAWAITLRMDYVKAAQRCLNDKRDLYQVYSTSLESKIINSMEPGEFKKLLATAVRYLANNETSAVFWIENKEIGIGEMVECIEKYLKRQENTIDNTTLA